MDKEKYLSLLERQNGYCECPELQALFKKRREAEKLEAKCDFFAGNVNLEEVNNQDGQFLSGYKKAAEGLHTAVEDYRVSIRKEARNAKLRLRFHDLESETAPRIVSYKNACEIQKEHDSQIITAHCLRCDQQVDIITG
jgi:hypothetical protein